MELRPYQSDLVAAIDAAFEDHGSVLLQLPTGGGKTRIAARVTEQAAEAGKRVWFIAHRREIAHQTSDTLTALRLPHGIVGPNRLFEPERPIQVCSIASLSRRTAALPSPDLMIWDECHHIAARSWSGLRALYPQARHLGLTATPDRLDGKGLAEHFDHLICGPTPAELIAAGHLSRYRLFAPTIPDLRGIGTTAGDYAKGELGERMGRAALVGDVVDHYRRLAPHARAVAFAVTVEASRSVVARFNAAGIPARHVDSATPARERDAAVAALANGTIRVLSNVEVFTEGFDLPGIDAVILLRPTKSLALYRQMVGRGLRSAPGKAATVILDHSGLAYEHGLPDDTIDWTLGGARQRPRGGCGERLRRCPDCDAVHTFAMTCSECGRAYEAGDRSIEEVYGELREMRGKSEPPVELERVDDFAERIQKSAQLVRRLFARGLPQSEDGFIPVQDGLNWVAAARIKPSSKLYPDEFPLGACETQAAFAQRFGVSAPKIGRLAKAGLPVASNGWVIITPALAWVAANPKRMKIRTGDTRRAFAKRVGTTVRVIQLATQAGLPLESDGSISTTTALAWWKQNGRTDEFEGVVAFCKRIGIGHKGGAPGNLRKRGLPIAPNGLVHIATGLEWIEKHGALRFPGKSKRSKSTAGAAAKDVEAR